MNYSKLTEDGGLAKKTEEMQYLNHKNHLKKILAKFLNKLPEMEFVKKVEVNFT